MEVFLVNGKKLLNTLRRWQTLVINEKGGTMWSLTDGIAPVKTYMDTNSNARLIL
jgi:hypothetical protein